MLSFIQDASNKNTFTFLGEKDNSGVGSFQVGGTSGAYLSLAQYTPFNFGAGDFTMECWVYITNYGAAASGLINNWQSGGEFAWYIGSTGLPAFAFTDVASGISTKTFTAHRIQVPLHMWTHLAVCRVGNNIRHFVNGVPDPKLFVSGTDFSGTLYFYNGVNKELRIGVSSDLGAGTYLNGNITQVRIIKGTGLYSVPFVPQTNLTAVSNTQLLLKASSKSNFLVDDSSNGFTMTRNGLLYFSPASPNISLDNWIPFTIPSDASFLDITCIGAGGGGGAAYSNSTNVARGGGGGGGSGGITRVTNIPTKYLPRTIYIQPGTGGKGALGNNGIGGVGGRSIVSLQPRFHFSNSNFIAIAQGGLGGKATITTAAGLGGNGAFIATSNDCSFCTLGTTTFLAGVAGANGGSGTVAPGVNSLPVSLVFVTGGAGGAGITTTNVEQDGGRQTAVHTFPEIYNTSKNTNDYSISFDTNKWVNTAPSANMAIGTNNYTIEFWWNMSASVSNRQDLFNLIAQTGSNRLTVIWDGTSALLYVSGDASAATTRITYTSNVSFYQSTWKHIALCRSGTNTRLFVNGAQVGSTFTSDTLNYTSDLRVYLGRDPAGATYMTGLISNFRVIVGDALYTSNFTPPSAALTAVANTKFLTAQSSTLIDNGPDALPIANGNSAAVVFGNPFANVNFVTSEGIYNVKPLVGLGGHGGYSFAAGAGGDGSDGSIGSGGGGAGAGMYEYAEKPKAGNGGPGAVIIKYW